MLPYIAAPWILWVYNPKTMIRYQLTKWNCTPQINPPLSPAARRVEGIGFASDSLIPGAGAPDKWLWTMNRGVLATKMVTYGFPVKFSGVDPVSDWIGHLVLFMLCCLWCLDIYPPVN